MIEDKQKHPQWDHMKQNDSTERQIVASRVERNQQKKQKSIDEETSGKPRIWVQIRLFPIWLRIVLVLLLLAGAAILGAMIGYGFVGDGQPSDVLKKETWIHILDIIKGKES
ncbi:DNA-directed RNA polymerase subunit beta [Saccharococcus sp. Marseille-Q5394]|uniref:DNA-directed RNA polymerase subunit beta n=1 Tax=Saccharococcus sp. Marseille-Q5394 TaxID=2972778 RepID=UPI0021C7E6B5|nr:DNA-directed RNA polymerase subunit beta [Saccharococcus sp. Marseille-Q5394]